MLSQFKSSESKTEARNQLAQIVTNFELDPLEVLKGIERYVGIIEDDPTKVLDYAIGEAHRYLCCYSDKSTAEIVKLSYNQRDNKSFASFIDAYKTIDTKVKEARRQ